MREGVSYQPRWVQLKQVNPTMIEADLHSFKFRDAKDKIFQCMSKGIINRDEMIYLIHGYNHGTVIRDYLDSPEFRKDCKDEGFNILRVFRFSNPGDTIIKIELPLVLILPNVAKSDNNWEKLKKLGKIRLNG